MGVKPFQIHIEDRELKDLQERLQRTRWPDEVQGAGWEYGAELAYIKKLIEYWKTEYDWRATEKKLNAYRQFRVNIDGLNLHFIHEKGKGKNPFPLIMTHGWPSSFVELVKLIPLLTDPANHGGDPDDSFDVVIPSLPGFGFSDRFTNRGGNVFKIADLWQKLMTQSLGYRRFGAQGSDWGVSISARLGFAYPDQVSGIHVTTLTGGTPQMPYPNTRKLSKSEEEMIERRDRWREVHGGYAHVQRREPQTYAYGLNDSPAGLAALLVDKFRSWSDCGGNVEMRFTKDELLTNIAIYWFTQTIHSSMRIYFEHNQSPWILGPEEKIQVPCAVVSFPKEMNRPLREWADRYYNVQRWTEFSSGGHFPAYEEPQLLAADIRAFFHR